MAAPLVIVARHSRDILREALLRVVLRPVADDLAGVGDAPEGAGVVRDTIEDLEWDTVLVGNIGRLDRLAEKLLQVALADVAGDVADIALARLIEELANVDLARRNDPQQDDLQLTAQ